MKIEANTIRNPLLGFKLDPGEPGLAPARPASHATLTVVAQEQHNLNRFLNDAAIDGRTVLQKKITYDVAFVGGFLTVRGGHTSVLSRGEETGQPDDEKKTGGPGDLNPPTGSRIDLYG